MLKPNAQQNAETKCSAECLAHANLSTKSRFSSKNVGDFHSNSKPIFCRKILSKDFVEHFVEHFVERLDAFCRRILSKDFVEGFCRNLGGILSKDCLEHFVGDGVVHLKNKFVLKFVLFWRVFGLRPNLN